jgi:hypothetical protein
VTSLDKLWVIGKDIAEIHQHTTAMGVPWHRVEPVTESNQLRVRPGQGVITADWVPDTTMHPAVKSVIRTQLSIRRCLGLLLEPSRLRRQLDAQSMARHILSLP